MCRYFGNQISVRNGFEQNSRRLIFLDERVSPRPGDVVRPCSPGIGVLLTRRRSVHQYNPSTVFGGIDLYRFTRTGHRTHGGVQSDKWNVTSNNDDESARTTTCRREKRTDERCFYSRRQIVRGIIVTYYS